MFTEMNCGACESYFQIESEEEEAVWLLVHRFMDSHVDCGFVSPTVGDSLVSFKKKVIKPRIKDESEEA